MADHWHSEFPSANRALTRTSRKAQDPPEGNVPTYQYACTECGHQLEAVQSFSDAPLSECPACQGRLRKLFNSVGIVFKGSGFYRTDSRGGSTSAESGKTSDSKGSSESKSDSKPETKSDGAAKPAAAASASSSSSSSSATTSGSSGSSSS